MTKIVDVVSVGDTHRLVRVGPDTVAKRTVTQSVHRFRIEQLCRAINEEHCRRLDAARIQGSEVGGRIPDLEQQLAKERDEHRAEADKAEAERAHTFAELRAAADQLRGSADAFASLRGALDDIPGDAEHGGLLHLIRRVLVLEEENIVRYRARLGLLWCGLVED